MGDQRRRGRGRSGRGGRIPRRGDSPQQLGGAGEDFVSFPLDVAAPLRVISAVDDAAVEAAMARTLSGERKQAAALAAVGGEGALAEVRVQVERHRDVLEQLARDLGADLSSAEPAPEAATTAPLLDLAADQLRAKLNWRTLQQAAYASGDRRIDRVVKGVLKEKDRHAEILATFAVREATRGLMRETE